MKLTNYIIIAAALVLPSTMVGIGHHLPEWLSPAGIAGVWNCTDESDPRPKVIFIVDTALSAAQVRGGLPGKTSWSESGPITIRWSSVSESEWVNVSLGRSFIRFYDGGKVHFRDYLPCYRESSADTSSKS